MKKSLKYLELPTRENDGRLAREVGFSGRPTYSDRTANEVVKMVIDANNKDFEVLNEEVWSAAGDETVVNCLGQRFIGAGLKGKTIKIEGIPGNGLGAYLNGAKIIVNGNAQDAVGDTMNDGEIIICGNVGDAVGYAMRGGEIYVEGNAGYRVGIHMKEYKTKRPVIVIGGRAGSFLGEYLAGGRIVVLGLHDDGKPIAGDFPCTGMHGGKIFFRGDVSQVPFPIRVRVQPATSEDWAEIEPCVLKFCKLFGRDADSFAVEDFTVVVPDSNNPYKQLYVAN